MKRNLRHINRLNNLLLESPAKLRADAMRHYKTCITKYFPKYKNSVSLPTIKILKNYSTIGRRKGGSYNYGTHTITVDGDIASNPELLQSVMYHETIHVMQYVIDGGIDWKKEREGYHGSDFIAHMQRINAGEGKELVTVRMSADSTTKLKVTKPFYVYVIKEKTMFLVAWSSKFSEKIIDSCKWKAKQRNALGIFYFETTDFIWKELSRVTANNTRAMSGIDLKEPLLLPLIRKAKKTQIEMDI